MALHQIQHINTASCAPPMTAREFKDYGRVMIVYDRQTNGTLPAISDIIQDTDSNANNVTSAFSGPNLNNRDRFMLLFDKRFMIPGCTNTTTALTNLWPNSTGGATGSDKDYGLGSVRLYRKLNRLVTQYKADSATPVIGDIATGGLYVVTLAITPTGQENFNITLWHSRMRYADV